MKPILTAVLALTTLAAPLAASAKDHGSGHGRGHAHGRDRHDDRDDRKAYKQGYRDGRSLNRDRRPHLKDAPPPYRARAAQRRYWNRGQVLPNDYRQSVIYDPYRYGLYPPPRGCRWMRVGDDVYLTQVSTGLILEVIRDTYL